MDNFSLAAVFSDNCVLQQNKPVRIFGTAESGISVRVSLTCPDGVICAEGVSIDGRWEALLPPHGAAQNCTLRAESEGRTIEFKNVAIGEVWLCGGQSNMEFELQHCTTGREHLENDAPNVRFYYTQKKVMTEPDFFESEKNTCWTVFTPESAKCWSAVGYLFGKRLSEKLGVTVGLIGCNWGGTSASIWMPTEALAENKETDSYLDDYRKGIEGKSLVEQKREYEEYCVKADAWNRDFMELVAKKPGTDWAQAEKVLGKNPWPGPINEFNPFRPSALYESMLLRVCPYTLRGWLFYQGESDDHKPKVYYTLFSRMIRAWRDAWRDDAPFLFVQLPGNQYISDPDYKHWCIIREAQQRVSRDVKNTGMICAIDAGEFNDIHPKNKEPIGERLYLLALEKAYRILDAEDAESPEPESIRFENSCARICYRHTGGGLEIRNGSEISGFELAGEDGKYLPAKAELLADGKTVSLRTEGIDAPKFARYLWTNYPEKVTLYGKNGLPALPFRTDGAEGAEDRQGGIKQIMEL